MKYSVALPETLHRSAAKHLVRDDGQEDLTFALYNPSTGADRQGGLVFELLLPRDGERLVHGNASFLPPYAERALAEAADRGCGLSFMHSHPFPGWQGMSRDDRKAEFSLAPRVRAATGLPLLGMTVGSDGAWSARFWEKVAPRTFRRRGCENVRVVGRRLETTFNARVLPPPSFGEELARTVSAWGELAQADLARLRIGIVGCGSVGMAIAIALALQGAARITLIDFDRIETRNRDRLLLDVRNKIGKLKVVALAEHLARLATARGFEVRALPFSIVEDEGYRAALDCDVLFSCVDRPWPRSVLNFIAYSHLVPVIDGGISIAVRPSGKLRHADWRAHTVTVSRPCLECLSQYDPGLVALERDGYLDDPKYVQGLPEDHELRRGENVFAFSMACASLQVLQLLSQTVAPSFTDAGAQRFRFVQSELVRDSRTECFASCPYAEIVASGDRAPFTVTGDHRAAQEMREGRGTEVLV